MKIGICCNVARLVADSSVDQADIRLSVSLNVFRRTTARLFGRSTIRNAPLARLRIVSSKVLGGTFCETAGARLFFPARPRPNAPGKVRRKIVRFRRETYRWSHIGVRLRRGECPGRFRRSNTPGYQKVYISMNSKKGAKT